MFVVVSLVAALAATARPSAASGGNASVHLAKTVTGAHLNPSLSLALTALPASAIPGDHVTYGATLTSRGGTLSVSGVVSAQATTATTATVASYFDYVASSANPGQGCVTDHGHDSAQWPPLAGFAAAQRAYSPVVPPVIGTGMQVAFTPVPAAGVNYSSTGDRVLGTTIAPGQTALWHYRATIQLSPSQLAALSDPHQVTQTRNTFHLEVTPGDTNAAPSSFTDVCDPGVFGVLYRPTTLTNASITIQPPTGPASVFTAASVPGLATMSPGASVAVAAHYTVPVVAAKRRNEPDGAYLARLQGTNGRALPGNATATATSGSGPVNAFASASTTEQIPVVTITKNGPGASVAGTTATFPLKLANQGDVAANTVAVTDPVFGGPNGTVTGVPAVLAAGASANAQATDAIPPGQRTGPRADAATVTWTDQHHNPYGPLAATFVTQVTAKPTVPVDPVSTTAVQGNFYPEDPNATSFVAKTTDTPAFGQTFPSILFNPPATTINGEPANGPNPSTRPFTDVTTDIKGNYAGTTIAQGNGQQAGVGPMNGFDAVFTANLVASKAEDITFTIHHDDGFIVGISNGATSINGPHINAPAATSFHNYPVMGAVNAAQPGTDTVAVHFPAAGTYPYELDYFESNGANLTLTMTSAVGSARPSSDCTTGPPGRWAPAMAYDAARNTVVLFGGASPDANHLLNDTWTFNGTTWTQQHPAHAPLARDGASMVYDAATKKILLFGGGLSPRNDSNETWSWDGTDWTQEHPTVNPPAVDDAGIAYDAIQHQVVLATTDDGLGSFDTWTWDGSNWTHKASGGPSPRATPNMTFDPKLGAVVMFGGEALSNGTAVSLNETWLWDGTTWTQQHPSLSPPGRNAAAMDYDATTGNIVLFGGQVFDSNTAFHPLGDTWIYDGTTWTQQHPASSPPAREQPGGAFDAATGKEILFGGAVLDSNFQANPLFTDTWLWDGTNWTAPCVARLWLGNNISGDVFATDTTGNVVTHLPNLPRNGMAFDGTHLYFGDAHGLIEQRSADGSQVLSQFTVPSPTSEDLAWDSTRHRLWRVDSANNSLVRIDVSGQRADATYQLPQTDPVIGPVQALGVAYDPSRDLLYVSLCGVASGCPDSPFQSVVLTVDPSNGSVTSTLFRTDNQGAGGLAYESDTDTLWAGGWANGTPIVRNMTRSGAVLSSFNRPLPGAGVDGLEFVGPTAPRNHGGVFVTGHDPDFHGVAGPAQTAAQHIIQRSISAVTGSNPNPRILLVTDVRSPGGTHVDSRQGLAAAGFTTFDVADYGSGTSGVLDLHNVNFANYDVVLVASDDGGWLRQDELDILDARASDITAYVNGGGGLVALAEAGLAGDGAPALTTHGQYGFLPCLAMHPSNGTGSEAGFVLTSVGQSLGLTNSDVGSNFYHNYFTSSCGYDVVDTDTNGNIVSLFQFANQPPPRAWQSMVYNSDKQRIEMFGGASAATFRNDNWVFDGNTWTQQQPPTSPSVRENAATAYDTATHTTVLFSGSGAPCVNGCPLRDLNDTWTFDGTTWTQQHPAHSPHLSGGTPIATYDAAHHVVVLVTSQNLGPGESQCCFDTWTWDGVDWTEHPGGAAPSGLYASNVAYDPDLQKVVLFGGDTAAKPGVGSNETWTWDGSSWSQIHHAVSPPARYAAGMDFDSVHHQIVLFGGFGTSGHLSDTWTFDGTTWTQQTPTLSPPARRLPVLTFDPAIGKSVLFGGFNGDTTGLLGTADGDTWLWDGSNWSLFGTSGSTVVGPPGPSVPLPPAAALALTPGSIPGGALTGQSETFTAAAMDGTGTPVSGVAVTFTVSGANPQVMTATTDGSGLAKAPAYVGFNAGTDSVSATATIAGQSAVANVTTFLWSAPATGPPPAITAPSPTDGSLVSKPVPVSATFTPPAGQSIASWEVTFQGQSPGSPSVTLASGSGTPPATLGTFDPTRLPNDTYAITISATASGGGTQSSTTTVAVFGNLKLGRYTTTYQDLNVPVNGFQMQVRRTYDSIDKRVGDFGVGWHVDVSNFRVSTNRQLGAGGWNEYTTTCGILCSWAYRTTTPHFVTVTYPDGHQEVFDFTPTGPQNTFIDFLAATTAFTARPGTNTTSKLEDARGAVTLSNQLDGNLYDTNNQPYAPTRFKLTTKDKRVFVLDTTSGLVSQTDPNGNSLIVDASGVHASNGESITYVRDGQGRITQISGPTGQQLTYSYSTAGDLSKSTDANANATTYDYDTNHNLLDAKGPGGQFLQRQTYGLDGRLATITDGAGNTTTVTTNVGGQQQTIVDPAGTLTTILTYDDLGDVVRRDDVFGGKTLTTRFTYDSSGRPAGRTDPLGNTWAGSYDTSGNLLQLESPTAHAAALTYGNFGNPLTYTDPNGHATGFGYDASLNLMSVTDALGHAETYTYDSAGHPLTRTDRAGHVWQATYDTNGNLATTTDPNSHTTTYVYDALGLLKTITDANNRTTSYGYDSVGNLIKKTDPNGHITSWTYDTLNRLKTQTDANGKVTSWTYDGAGNVLTKTDPLGRVTTYAYDQDGRLATTTNPAGDVTISSYDGGGRLASQADPLGRVTSNAYDDAGRLIRTTQPNGAITTTSYDPENHPLTVADALGHTTTSAYDAAGQLTSVTDPLGHVTTYTLDALGQQHQIIDAAGQTTTQAFDPLGNLTSVTNPAGETTTNTYDPAGNLATVKDPLGHITTDAYDPANKLASVTDPLGHATTYGYDPAGNQTTITDALGHITTTSYDALNRPTTVTDPLNQTTTTAFDDAGQLTSTQDARGNITTFGYDAAGRRLSITDPNGGSVTFGYDPAGEQTNVTDPNLHTTTYTFDDLGNVATTTDPLGRTSRSAYDATGRLSTSTDARGIITAYGYDAAGELTSQNAPGRPIAFSYDALGRRATMTDVTGATIYGHDAASRVTTDASPEGTLTYTYNGDGTRHTMTTSGSHVVTYGYDAAQNLTSLKDWLSHTTSYGYDNTNRPASITRPNGVNTIFGYDNAGHVTTINHDGPGGALGHYTYTYDGAGNRTSVTSGAGGESYTLDKLGRLTKATYPNGDVISYTYDAASNRKSITVNGTTTNATYDAANELATNAATTYTYDAAGNQLTAGSSSFAWDSTGHLASSTVGATTTSYAYNGDGLRASATIGTATTPYLWDIENSLPTLVSDGGTSYLQTSGGVQEQVGSSSNTTYPLADSLGSIRSITDAAGGVIGTANYDAFGSVRTASGTMGIFGFGGQQTDATGLVYLRARYLNPTLGNFVSQDSVVPSARGTQGYNQYLYAAGNPVTNTDPSGRDTAEYALPLGAFNPTLPTLAEVASQIGWRGFLAIAVGLAGLGCVSSPACVPALRGDIQDFINFLSNLAGKTASFARAIADVVTKACAVGLAANAITGLEIPGNPCHLPISVFAPGLDTFVTTVFHIDQAISILHEPSWLHYTSDTSLARGWYNRVGVRAAYGEPCTTRPTGFLSVCDEYPFYTTIERGPPGNPLNPQGASLLLVPAYEQSAQGGYLNAFYNTCGKQKLGTEGFVVSPSPLPLTKFVCGG